MKDVDDTDLNLLASGCNDRGSTFPQIGHIQIERELGRGRFGVVYLGYDHDQPCPRVAVKVPKADRIDTSAYLAEARIVADSTIRISRPFTTLEARMISPAMSCRNTLKDLHCTNSVLSGDRRKMKLPG